MTTHPEDLQKIIDKLISNPDLISRFETAVGMDFIPQKTSVNICFAENNDELRDDFKQVFTSIDLLDYFYGMFHSIDYRDDFFKNNFSNITYPKDTDTFWQLVKLGRKNR